MQTIFHFKVPHTPKLNLLIKLVFLLALKTDLPETILKILLLKLANVLLVVMHACSLFMEFYPFITLVPSE